MRDGGLDAEVRPDGVANALQRPPSPALSLVVRGPPIGPSSSAMRAAAQGLDPELPVEFHPLDESSASSLDAVASRSSCSGVFAAVALLLAVTGIYGVTAYSVAQRTHEFGSAWRSGLVRAPSWPW